MAKAMRAEVTLRDDGPASYHRESTESGNGYSFVKGEKRTITNPSDILYFLSQVGFSVEMLDGAKPPRPERAAPVVEEEAEAEEDEEEEDDEPKGPVTSKYKRVDLVKMTKAALMELNDGEKIGAKLDPTMSKLAMVNAIDTAQNGAEDEDEDEEDTEDEDE